MKNTKHFFLFLVLLCLAGVVKASTFYWVGDSGDWSDYSHHWATTSGGGTFYTNVPTSSDNVVFDNNSFSASGFTLNINTSTPNCKDFTWTETDDVTVTSSNTTDALSIYGNMSMSRDPGWAYMGQVVFRSTTAGKTITTAGIYFKSIIIFGTASGSFTLQDSLVGERFYLYAGAFTATNKKLKFYYFLSGNVATRSGDFSGSKIECSSLNFSGTGLTLTATGTKFTTQSFTYALSSTIDTLCFRIADYYTPYCTFSYNTSSAIVKHLTAYDDLFVSMDGLTIKKIIAHKKLYVNGYSFASHINYAEVLQDFYFDGLFSYDTLRLNNPGYKVGLGSYLNVGVLTNTASCVGYTTITSIYPGSPMNITKTSGTVNLTNVILRDINGTGGATFNASNSVALGGVSGWNISSSPSSNTLYWIGGSGNWTDPNHWSTSSGGSPYSCSPGPFDDVNFDNNSFSGNDTVRVDISSPVCHDMNWNTSGITPFFIDTNLNISYINRSSLNFFGSLYLEPDLDWQYPGTLIPTGNGIHHIDASQKSINELDMMDSTSYLLLEDSLYAGVLELKHGTVDMNGYNWASSNVDIYGNSSKIFMRTGVLKAVQWNSVDSTSIIFADSSTINADNMFDQGHSFNNLIFGNLLSGGQFEGVNTHVHQLISPNWLQFYESSANSIDIAVFSGDTYVYGGVDFGYAEFQNNAYINHGNSFDTLYLNNPGWGAFIENDSTQTIGMLLANGSAGNEINVFSTSPGTQANLDLGTDACLDYIEIQDMNVTTSTLYAGSNGTDLGNNSGVSFTDCSSPRLANPVVMTSGVFPNPTNGETTLNYSISEDGSVLIELFDVSGKCIYREEQSSLAAGKYSEKLPMQGLQASIYDCRVTLNGKTQSIRVVKTE